MRTLRRCAPLGPLKQHERGEAGDQHRPPTQQTRPEQSRRVFRLRRAAHSPYTAIISSQRCLVAWRTQSRENAPMTQILTPFQDALRSRRDIGRAAKDCHMSRRMCWTCQTEKPIKGGEFPGQGACGQRGQQRSQRFRCADCGLKRLLRLQEKAGISPGPTPLDQV